LDRIESMGGEGLMLRQPGSLYEAGRSHTLLKVKRFQDTEARVIKHLPGAGRHKGRLGALLVELAGGTRFSVGTGFSDAQRENPPAIGSVITFRFQELTDGGVPRFPSFVRVRADIPSKPRERTLLEAADA
jgi:DNA ligase-1